jgi:hypothetical protein
MRVEQNGNATIIRDTQGNLNSFIQNLWQEHTSLISQNLILDITQNANVTISEIKLFSELSKKHKKNKKSFVIVAQDIDYNGVPNKLDVVPSILEAHDIIDMEEIERDLGF